MKNARRWIGMPLRFCIAIPGSVLILLAMLVTRDEDAPDVMVELWRDWVWRFEGSPWHEYDPKLNCKACKRIVELERNLKELGE